MDAVEAEMLETMAEQAETTVVAFARASLRANADKADPHYLQVAANAAIVAAALRDIVKRGQA